MNKNNQQFLIACVVGVEVIGMNLYLYGFGNEKNRRWIVVDYGIGFDVRKYQGAQFITIDPDCLGEILPKIEAIIITHAHEDHMGAVLYLMQNQNIPIYVTNFARAMLLEKIYEFGSFEPTIKLMKPKQDIIFYEEDEKNDIKITPIAIPHSIPETMALLISYHDRYILHTSDFCFEKSQKQEYKGFNQFLKQVRPNNREIDILLCDSTGILTKKPQVSEKEVRHNLEKIFIEAKSRVFVTCFSSNIERIISVYKAAEKSNRNFIVIGKAMQRAIRAAANANLWKYKQPKDLYQFQQKTLQEKNNAILISGCQGEQNAAMTKMAFGNNRKLKVKKDDLIIFSARAIPGNEVEITTVQNALIKEGANIITNNEAAIHSGGHANEEQISFFLEKIKPKLLIPMHGELRHTKKAVEIAEKIGIEAITIKNGQVLQWNNKQKIPEKNPAGTPDIKTKYLAFDGNQLINGEDKVYKERQKMAFAGYINIILIKNKNHQKIYDVKIITKGIPEKIIEKQKIIYLVKNLLQNTDQQYSSKNEMFQQYLSRAISKAMAEIWGKKPLCDTIIVNLK